MGAARGLWAVRELPSPLREFGLLKKQPAPQGDDSQVW
jgi:hypothetical protein